MPLSHTSSLPNSSIYPPQITVDPKETDKSPTDAHIMDLVSKATIEDPGLDRLEFPGSSSDPWNVPVGTRPRSATTNTPVRQNLDPSVEFWRNRSLVNEASYLSAVQEQRAPSSIQSSHSPWNERGTVAGPGACSNLSAGSQLLPPPSRALNASYMEPVALYPGDSASQIWASHQPNWRNPQVNLQDLAEQFSAHPRTEKLEFETFSDGRTKLSISFRDSQPCSQEPTPVMGAEEFQYQQPQREQPGYMYHSGTGEHFRGNVLGTQSYQPPMGAIGWTGGAGFAATIAGSTASFVEPYGHSAPTPPSISVASSAADLGVSHPSRLSGKAPEFNPGNPYLPGGSVSLMDNATNQQGRTDYTAQPEEETERDKVDFVAGASPSLQANQPAISEHGTPSPSDRAMEVEKPREQAEEAPKSFPVKTGASRDDWRTRSEEAGSGSTTSVRGCGRGRGIQRGRGLYQPPRGRGAGGDHPSVGTERQSGESSGASRGPAGSYDATSPSPAREVEGSKNPKRAVWVDGYIGKKYDPEYKFKKAAEMKARAAQEAKEVEEAKGKK
ncbi:hypothetical protein QFC20_005807 [Naganishia adeliensis]|uniref:Uncharacterized protein n=1 Tax=Naganishia adeliensis TaxID=92952 RepID=A0ACC2VIJ3_9TREE|nr:hypothetical protein QFC20_005807 [Naganishia adeliensis]